MNVGRIAGGAAAAIGTGLAAGALARHLMYERTNVSPEVRESRSTGSSQGDGYRAVLLPVAGVMGGVAALAYASSLMGRGSLAAGLGAAALGGAGLGMAVGYAIGAVQGSDAADATYGPTHAERADELFEHMDVDGSGVLELEPQGRLSESMSRSGRSIERLLRAADADADARVTRSEYIGLLEGLDADGSGKLSPSEVHGAASKYGSYV